MTVIAIIGILAGMLSVVVPMVQERAARMDASANCRSIAIAYGAYANTGTTAKNISMEKSGTVTKWAVYLTQKNPEINNAKLWFIARDDRAPAVIPQFVINTSTNVEDPAFVAATPKSWAVVAGAPRNSDPNYPLIWTRGLKGKEWDKINSPWKGKGGHIGYMSGTVAWAESTLDEETGKGIFTDYLSKQPTESITAAIGTAAKALEDN